MIARYVSVEVSMRIVCSNCCDLQVIQGLDLAIGLMNEGEKCQLKILSRLAYGFKGLAPKIPADATVCYTVELLSVHPEEEPESLTVEERKLNG